MPFFKDLGGASDKLLGGPGGHEAYVDTQHVTVKAKAANGTNFTFDKDINDGAVSATAKVDFKHSSGVNFKKIQVGTNGKVNVEAEVAEAMKNTKLYVKIGTLKEAVNSISADGKTKKSECGALGFKFDNKDVAADASVDILAMDAPLLKFSAAFGVPGVDGLTAGFDAQYATSLDTWGTETKSRGATLEGAKGLQMEGPTCPAKIVKGVALNYSGSDFDVTASSCPAKKSLDVKYHQKLSGTTAFGAKIEMLPFAKKFEPKITLGGSYAYDNDTNVYAKMDASSKTVHLAFEQAINSSVKLTCATAIAADTMNSSGFGASIEFSN
jgi:hypothetical protein